MFRSSCVIVGGGIGGLATAIALKQIGINVTVFERAPELREVGAGLGLSANATSALEKLGVLDQIARRSQVLTSGCIRDQHGRILKRFRLPQTKTPMLALHRADLQQVLYEALPRDCISLGKACTDVESCGSRVTAILQDGTRVETDLLVGADGLHSVVRRQLGFETALNYSGYIAWRGVTSFTNRSLPENEATEAWGAGQRAGIIPLSAGRLYWFATANLTEPAEGKTVRSKPELLRMFQDWFAPFPEIISSTEMIIETPIFDRDPRLPWVRGRAVLIGDAAHATTPNLGQGASMALEDAVVVSQCLSQYPDLQVALQRFQTERHPRCSSIVRFSRLAGAIGQWRNPIAVWLRDRIVSLTPESSMLRSIRLIHAYEPSQHS